MSACAQPDEALTGTPKPGQSTFIAEYFDPTRSSCEIFCNALQCWNGVSSRTPTPGGQASPAPERGTHENNQDWRRKNAGISRPAASGSAAVMRAWGASTA